MVRSKRMANYELLRILAMVMVVVMHFLAHADDLPVLDVPLDAVRIIGALLEAFCLVAVNTYVFISGYFGVKSNFKPGKAVNLLCQIWFYALLIPLVFFFAGVPTVAQEQGIYGLVQYLFPIETEHYWFATSYFMLYLLSPILNVAVKNMSKKQLQIAIGSLLILFSGIKSISPIVFAFDRYGYDLPWFICVYLTAAYFSLYGSNFFEKKGWFVYIGSCLLGFTINLAMWVLSQKWDSFSYYFTVPFHYNFIFCLTGAIGLFYGFSNISIKEGWIAERIRKIGSLCFGVYLLHEHIDLRFLWYGWIRQMINPGGKDGLGFFFWELICCVVILFVMGIIIDWLRSRLFSISITFMIGKTKLYQWVKELDQAFQTK
ncbi:MAG: acyltransferase [Lachnospiraceae bacterium]|nr:acyltransferase [Lachnospiraceae bacterium]